MMFGKKCRGCGERISGKYSFCPSCGTSVKQSKQKDLGMLGENDLEEFDNMMENSFLGKMMGKMFENTMKMLEREMQKEMHRKQHHPQVQPKTNFQLFINGKKVNIEGVEQKQKEEEPEKEFIIDLPNEPLKDFAKLPRKEPKTNIRRLSDKVIYEISMPGIKSEKNISIVNLENSIEVKGVGNKVAYKKIIPISMPITDYNISRGKLILELGYD